MTTEQATLLAVGLVTAAIGVTLAALAYRKSTRWERARGDVERYEEDDEKVEFAVVSFIDREGRKIEFRSSVSGRLSGPVPVLYEPNFPPKASVATFGQLWFIPLAFFLAGIGISYCSTLAE